MNPLTSDSPKKVSWFSFWSLTLIQSMNSLNEKGGQFLLIALGIWMGVALEYPLSILIVLPFVLFSPLAGWLADRYCKTRLLQAMVLLQIVVLAGMSYGLFMHQIGVALAFFAVFCIQAMFFSPAKKGLVKDVVGSENIGFASGILEITSMLALLLGQIGAFYIVYHLLSKWGMDAGWEAAAWPCVFCGFGAIVVFILSLSIPRFKPEGTRPFAWSLLWEHFAQLKMLWDNKVLRHCEIGIGYFWFIAGTMMLIALAMAKEANPVALAGDDFMRILSQQKDSALLIAWISGGSIIGGATASVICAKRVRVRVSIVAGFGLSIACLAMCFAPFGTVAFYASLALAGFTAAGFLVPLNARLQDRADNDKRGDVIAAGNLVDCFLGIMSVVVQYAMHAIGMPAQLQCAILSVTTILVTLYILVHRRAM
ncbi:MAG: MFS transporter [Akkermansia sp.]